MLEDGGAEVNGDAGVDESGEQVRAGADPAQAQATPMGLARRADGDGTGVVGGEGQGGLAVVGPDLGDRLTVVVSQPVSSTGTGTRRAPVRRNDSAALG